MKDSATIPVVLVFSGNDPSGGAGIQADIESIASMGCHAAPVITALTVQDTQDVKLVDAVDSGLVAEQARAVFEDMPVAAVKIGLLGSLENVEAIQSILIDYPNIPVVLDPIVESGSGTTLLEDDVIDAMISLLLPLTTVLTPNSKEIYMIAPQGDNIDSCAQEILEAGCEYVLVTGSHENTPEVQNILFGNLRRLESYTWKRLPFNYHGSGCTLAASLAGLLAQNIDPMTAIHEAQEYTWETLKYGYRIGMGQHLPNRQFWARDHTEEHEKKS